MWDYHGIAPARVFTPTGILRVRQLKTGMAYGGMAGIQTATDLVVRMQNATHRRRRPTTTRRFDVELKPALIGSVMGVLILLLVSNTSTDNEIVNHLSFTLRQVPVGGRFTDEKIEIWTLSKSSSDDRLEALVSIVRNARTGDLIDATNWPDSHGQLLEATNTGICTQTSPPTVASVNAVISDSVGPIPLMSTDTFAFDVKDPRELVSRQGPLLMMVRQPKSLDTRIVNEFAEPAGSLVAQITKISIVRENRMPRVNKFVKECRNS